MEEGASGIWHGVWEAMWKRRRGNPCSTPAMAQSRTGMQSTVDALSKPFADNRASVLGGHCARAPQAQSLPGVIQKGWDSRCPTPRGGLTPRR